MSENINEKKSEKKFEKLVESIGKATNRYRRVKKKLKGLQKYQKRLVKGL